MTVSTGMEEREGVGEEREWVGGGEMWERDMG